MSPNINKTHYFAIFHDLLLACLLHYAGKILLLFKFYLSFGEKDKYIQSNLNGSNTFGTMKISSRQG